MASTIKIKNSATTGSAPSSLEQGEFAINVADGNLFYGDGSSVKQNFVFDELEVKGNLTAQQYIVSSSVTYTTQSFSSGSTVFGDTQDDTHLFTGSINVTGSITATSFAGDGSSLTGVGTVDTSGTPADDQVAVFTDADTIEGTTKLTFSNSQLLVHSTNTDNTGVEIYGGVFGAAQPYISPVGANSRINFGDGTSGHIFDFLNNKIAFDSDSTNTFIQADTDNPENLELHADGNIELRADDNLEIHGPISTNITASGNISASGIVTANKVYLGSRSAIETSGDFLKINEGALFTNGVTINRGSFPQPIGLYGNVTASGNVSSSGDITCANITVAGDITSVGDDVIIGDDLVLGSPAAKLRFSGSAGGGNEAIQYYDSNGDIRNVVMFTGTNTFSIMNRAPDGKVEIRANTSTGGSGGEVTVAEFLDDLITLNVKTRFSIGGSSSSPALSLTTDPNTGIYFPTGDALGLVAGSSERFRASSTGNYSYTGLTVTSGDLTVANDIVHYSDADTQIRFSIDNISLEAGGTQGAELDVTGSTLPNVKHNIYDTASLELGAAGGSIGDIVKFGGTSTTAGKVYYLKPDGTWGEAQANAGGTASSSLAVALGDNSTTDGMCLRGIIYPSTDPGAGIGNPIFLSDTNSGQMLATAPDTSGDFVRIVGHQFGTNLIYFNPSPDFIELS